MSKKGQITIFIILGFILLIAVGFIFYIKGSNGVDAGEILAKTPIEMQPVRLFVDSCVKDVAIPGIYLLASKGGYIYSYDKVLNVEYGPVAYHIENSEDISPDKEFMERELAKFIEESLKLCINNLEDFDGYDFEFGEMEIKPEINENVVFVGIKYPITLKRGRSKIKISRFDATYPVRFGHILDIKDEIIPKIKNSKTIDVGYISSFDVEVSLLPYDKNNLVYSIFDNKSSINDDLFIFNFGVNSRFLENKPPIMHDIPEKTAYVDEIFIFRVTASDPDGDTLTFKDETGLFDIDQQTGNINFIPTPADNGSYEIPIIASDGVNEADKILKLDILTR